MFLCRQCITGAKPQKLLLFNSELGLILKGIFLILHVVDCVLSFDCNLARVEHPLEAQGRLDLIVARRHSLFLTRSWGDWRTIQPL